ncbi:hypothetical protein CK203_072728 [Vitis vinifera]|uniref:Uncharacterized protein n=1 Tax=Vitis vinifera TaxID=29760 RepID=A0A438EZ20_VITVI|nr:hypothetical protein CK203_072728 [Vitis vinifera]
MGHSLTGLENPGRILSGFKWVINYFLGRHFTAGPASPVTLNVQFSVVQELSPFNVILGRTWLHYMKVIPSTYHQMVSFLTKDGQINIYDSQLTARQCYQIARETGPVKRMHPSLSPAIRITDSNYWVRWTKIPAGSRSLANNPNFGRRYSPYEYQFPPNTRRNPENAERPQTKL